MGGFEQAYRPSAGPRSFAANNDKYTPRRRVPELGRSTIEGQADTLTLNREGPAAGPDDSQPAIRELFAPPHFQPFVHVGGGRFRPAVCKPEQRGVRFVFPPRLRGRARARRPAALGTASRARRTAPMPCRSRDSPPAGPAVPRPASLRRASAHCNSRRSASATWSVRQVPPVPPHAPSRAQGQQREASRTRAEHLVWNAPLSIPQRLCSS